MSGTGTAEVPPSAAMQDIPLDYQPYERVRLGTNVLENTTFLLKVDEFAPLLIGKGGRAPSIWLWAPETGGQWFEAIRRNVALHPSFQVTLKEENGAIAVEATAFGKRILRVSALESDSCQIDQLDLRPLGLRLYLDDGILSAGEATLSGNVFSGLDTALTFGS